MAATQERRLSEFPTAANILLTTLLFGSVVDTTSTSGYDSVKILASDLANAILGDFTYTQDLQTYNKTIFGAINELRVLSGSATPDNAIGANNQLYIKYDATDYSVVGLYVKLNNAWREISTGGGGGSTNYIECTQAQYDAWEQGGELDPDTLYFITDGNIGNDIIDDSTTSASKVWSSDKTDREIQAVASGLSDIRIIQATTNIALTANACTVVSFSFTVPQGYTILTAFDNSYIANVVPSVIRINPITNTVIFNYYSTVAYAARDWDARAVIAKNVTLPT